MAAVNFKRITSAANAETRTHTKILLIMNIMLAVATAMCGVGSMLSWGVVLFVFAVGIGIIAVVNTFRGLTNSQLCDVKLSMPMTNLERYISRLLTVFYLHILPLMLYGFVAVSLAYGVEKAAYPDDTMTYPQCLVIYLAMLSAVFFIDAITIFCTSCCGALAESVYFSLIAMGCLSIAPWLFYYQLVSNIAHINKTPEFIRYWTFTAFSALDFDKVSDAAIAFLVSILVSCAVIFFAYLIYRRRDARTVGSPIVSRLFFEMIMALGVVTIYSMFMFSSNFEVGVIIVAVIYFVINIIVSRSKINIKAMVKWLLKLAATTAAFVIIVSVGISTNAFGAYDYMPHKDMDKMYDCVFDLNASLYNSDGHYSGDYIDYESYDLTDEQIREAVKIIRDYGRSELTFEEGFEDCFFDSYSYEWQRDDDPDEVNFSINVSEVKIRDIRGSAEGDYVRDEFIWQSVTVSRDDLDSLLKDLKEIGLNVEISNNRDEYIYGDTYSYSY